MKPKPLPRSVNICSTRYKVVRKANVIDNDGDHCFGTCEPLKACITVEKKLDGEVARTTLEHEIAHGVMEESGAKYILAKFIENPDHLDEAEEMIVRVFVPAFITALRGLK